MINPMMLPPDQWGSGEPTPPYDVPRGTCPRCGSTQVVHLVIGMPASPEELGSGPDWVSWSAASTRDSTGRAPSAATRGTRGTTTGTTSE